MGKGDKRTRRGKIAAASYGNPRKQTSKKTQNTDSKKN